MVSISTHPETAFNFSNKDSKMGTLTQSKNGVLHKQHPTSSFAQIWRLFFHITYRFPFSSDMSVCARVNDQYQSFSNNAGRQPLILALMCGGGIFWCAED
jgi:hypothetical protein